MAKNKYEKKKTTKKDDDLTIRDIIKKSVEEAKVEIKTLPEPEPEEVPEVVKKVKKQPVKEVAYIEVLYFGYKGKGLIHGGRANVEEYRLSGNAPATVTNPEDIAFFTMKAERNPSKWKVI